MKKKDFLISLEDILELDEGSLKGTEPLDSFEEWDSLAVISFISLVDEMFDEIIDGDLLLDAKTVQDLLDLVSNHIEG
jgi:acyl carrier protein